MRDIINIIDTSYFEVDLMQEFNFISFGVAIGSNSFTFRGESKIKRPDNLYIDVSCLFWTLGIEIKRRK